MGQHSQAEQIYFDILQQNPGGNEEGKKAFSQVATSVWKRLLDDL
jgi:hypothetical protein